MAYAQSLKLLNEELKMFGGKKMSKRTKGDNAGMGCLVLALLAVFFMPLVGVYMVFEGNDQEKGIGVALTIVGVIVWIMFKLI